MKRNFNKKILSIVLVLALVAGLFGGYLVTKANKASAKKNESSVKEKVHEAVKSYLEGKTIVKEIYVKNKIYNIVVK